MDPRDIAFQREQLDWQKRKFMLISVFAMTGTLLAAVSLFFAYFSPTLRTSDRAEMFVELTAIDIEELTDRQAILSHTIDTLEARLNDVAQYSRSLGDSIVTLEELVTALKQDVEDLRGDG